jgi:CheY-like chemotaxis protein
LPEAGWFESRRHGWLFQYGVVALLGFGWRDVADRLQKPVDDLGEFGFTVVGPASNLADAVAAVSTEVLDCALIDIGLGAESAIPVVKILTDRHIPIVIMTGANEMADGTSPDIPVLLKPFSVEGLRLALERVLDTGSCRAPPAHGAA